MHPIVKWIICGTVALALIVLACLYFIPQSMPINLTITLEKHDGKGNVQGTISIDANGTWEKYLLQNDRLILTIDDFDHFYNIRPLNPIPGDPPYFSLHEKKSGYNSVCYIASSTITGEDSVLLFVKFQKDLSGWSLNTMPSPYIREEFKDDPSFHVFYDFNWQPWVT